MTAAILISLCLVCSALSLPARDFNYQPPAPQPSYSQPQPSYSQSQRDFGDRGDEKGMPFEYGYAVKDEESGNDFSHNSKSDGEITEGEYRIALPDGRLQIVTYVADHHGGFQADVQYEGEASYDEPERRQSHNSPQQSYPQPQPSYQQPQQTYPQNLNVFN